MNRATSKKDAKKDFQKLVQGLENNILTGFFKPRERLVEANLAEMFGVSRYWIRDALKILETRGVVKVTPYKGAVVAELNEEEVEEIFVIRVALEQLAARLAMERLAQADLADLGRLCDRFEEALKAGQIEEMIGADTKFHDSIFILAHNQNLRRIITELRNRCHIIRYSAWSTPERLQEINQEHRALVSAMAAGDLGRVLALAEAHIGYAKKHYLFSLRTGEALGKRRPRLIA